MVKKIMKQNLPLSTALAKRPRVRTQKKKGKAKVKPTLRSTGGMALNVPLETERYVNSLCSPDKFAGAGIPNWPALPTLKSRAFIRGILTVGSGGVGFVYVAPEQLGIAPNPALLYTQPAFAGNTFSLAAGVATASSNAQFDQSLFGTTQNLARWRIVSACLRARYISKEIDRGGSIISFAHPEHISLTGMAATNVLAFNSAKKVPVNREWTTVLYCPILNAWQTTPNAEGTPDYGDRFMGIMVESGTSGGQFEFEFFGNYEYEGPNIRGKTLCINDPVGVSVVQASMQSIPPTHTGNNDAPFRASMWERFKEFVFKSVTRVGPVLKEIATKSIPIVAEASLGALAAM